MAGRDRNLGDDDSGNSFLRNHARYLSRIVRGQIVSLEPEIGRAQLSTIEVFGNRNVTVPALWFSAKGANSAWGRYMPFGGEHVHVAYRNDDSAVVLGYDMTAPGEKQDDGGWPYFKELKDNNTAGYAEFFNLNPGEFDFKSSGGSYIFGSNAGTLLLSGGQAFISLDRASYKIESKAAGYKYSVIETSNIRFGSVFRKETSLSEKETQLSNGELREFLIDLNIPVGTSPSPQSLAKVHFGNIVDNNNLIENSSYGKPLRMKISLGDATNAVEVFKLNVDNEGNVHIVQLPTASKVGWQVGLSNISVNGQTGEFIFSTSGVTQVSATIAEYLQVLWMNFKVLFDAFALHVHGTGVGPSGPPTPTMVLPSWDNRINSNRVKIPQN